MQSLESSVYAGPGPTEGTSASVGQASMQRVHVPQRSGAGVSGSMSSEVSNSPRKNQEPIGSLMRHVFLPIHPSPARLAYARSSNGAVSTQILFSYGWSSI